MRYKYFVNKLDISNAICASKSHVLIKICTFKICLKFLLLFTKYGNRESSREPNN